MRTIGYTLAGVLLASVAGTALAQNKDAPPPAPAAAAATPAAQPDPVVATVNGAAIHLSDVKEAIASLPDQYRGLPAPMLYPMMIDQLVDRKAMVLLAEKQGLEKDPHVLQQVARAQDSALQNALLSREVGPQVTEAKVKQRYDETVAGKPGEPEVHARHILVANEDDAKKIIAQLKAGGDFAALAKQHSTDPGGAAQGGDLGWFKKGDMQPDFSAAAFALKPGQITEIPVHTQYGWHVIKVEEVRTAPPATFEQARDQIRQEMIQEGVRKVVAQAREGITIEKFNPDGSKPKPTDTAEPPPPAPK